MKLFESQRPDESPGWYQNSKQGLRQVKHICLSLTSDRADSQDVRRLMHHPIFSTNYDEASWQILTIVSFCLAESRSRHTSA